MQRILSQMVVLKSTSKGPQFKVGKDLYFVFLRKKFTVKPQFFNLGFWNFSVYSVIAI